MVLLNTVRLTRPNPSVVLQGKAYIRISQSVPTTRFVTRVPGNRECSGLVTLVICQVMVQANVDFRQAILWHLKPTTPQTISYLLIYPMRRGILILNTSANKVLREAPLTVNVHRYDVLS